LLRLRWNAICAATISTAEACLNTKDSADADISRARNEENLRALRPGEAVDAKDAYNKRRPTRTRSVDDWIASMRPSTSTSNGHRTGSPTRAEALTSRTARSCGSSSDPNYTAWRRVSFSGAARRRRADTYRSVRSPNAATRLSPATSTSKPICTAVRANARDIQLHSASTVSVFGAGQHPSPLSTTFF
jgi:hypothetical protein